MTIPPWQARHHAGYSAPLPAQPLAAPDVNRRPKPFRIACCAALLPVLAACGGGEVGGRLSGLGADRGLTLVNNDEDPLELRQDGRFTFSRTIGPEKDYAVTVLTQPVGQSCTVTDGSGTINAAGDSVDSVRVACTDRAALTGTLAGLRAGTALTLANGTARLTLVADGPFAFAETLADGTAYEVTVQSQPLGALCTVESASGVFRVGTATLIAVSCF